MVNLEFINPTCRLGLFDSTPSTGELRQTGEIVHLQAQPANDAGIYLISFNPNSTRLVSAGDDNSKRLWDPQTGVNVLTIPCAESVYKTVFSPDGSRLAVLPFDRTVRLMDAGER